MRAAGPGGQSRGRALAHRGAEQPPQRGGHVERRAERSGAGLGGPCCRGGGAAEGR